MDCQVCGTHLPSDARACPNCGTLTPAAYTHSGASPYDPTTPAVSGSSPSITSAPPPPPTQYGANPYESSWQSPYPVNPYEAPPPPPPRRPGKRIGSILGVVILVLLLLGGGVFAWLVYSSAHKAGAVNEQAATATAQVIATATANFTANGTFTISKTTYTKTQHTGQNTIYSYTQDGVNNGDLTGTFMDEETSTLYPDNTSTFSGRATCTCTVAGKSGRGAFHFFAPRREVVKYRKKAGERQEHESQEEQTATE